ncbi:MAG: Gfo/Idh/MocA family oxidoreductase [bacterium]|nr:Gfo/Idh/MocA family oxidoreductase [bacterium]
MINYGVIGTGMMGMEHIANILALDGARVTAIADPHPPSRQEALAALNGSGEHQVAAFTDHRQLLRSGLCNALVLATPNMTHFDLLGDILATDLHVLVEKPLCTEMEHARWVVETQAKRAGMLWVGMEYRYKPAIARLITEVRSGTVGDLKMLAVREHRFPFLPKVADWNRFDANTGGTLVEKSCHHFDLMNHIMGSRPTRIYASGNQDVNHLDERYGGRQPDILDNAYVVVDYEDGKRALLDLCMFAEGGENQEEVVAVGDLGKVEARLPSGVVFIGSREKPWFSPDRLVPEDTRIAYAGGHHGASYIEHLEFIASIHNGVDPQVSAYDGLLAVAMGTAAHRSIDEGRPINLSEVLP